MSKTKTTDAKSILDIHSALASRYETIGIKEQLFSIHPFDRLNLMLDLACVAGIFPEFRWADLLETTDGNFLHDLCGIESHLNRNTGQLMDCFVPRFAH